MKNYEKISEDVKIRWLEGFDFKGQVYTQVSGYVFNNENELLIVKGEKSWAIPGGHPEENENAFQTLEREIMEEACVTITDVKYIGAVEVVEGERTYYQLRFVARADKVLPFKQDFETVDRLFVKLKDLKNYIPWTTGSTFKEQMRTAKQKIKI